ncbi:MAG TPA: hypothetical protein VK110_04395 [Salinisphaeraceae bacterium]|nr:hypothetical protein [Salinisphaeraceae bacterium]
MKKIPEWRSTVLAGTHAGAMRARAMVRIRQTTHVGTGAHDKMI